MSKLMTCVAALSQSIAKNKTADGVLNSRSRSARHGWPKHRNSDLADPCNPEWIDRMAFSVPPLSSTLGVYQCVLASQALTSRAVSFILCWKEC
jgi:hypothetical protein